MRLIADITETVGKLIWRPFLVLFLLMLARNPYFDKFDWSPSLLLIFGLNMAFLLSYAFLLRRAARKARDKELNLLHRKLIQAEGMKKGPVQQIKELIGEVEDLKKGAFSPLISHPIVPAVLLIVGGIGIPKIVEYFSGIY